MPLSIVVLASAIVMILWAFLVPIFESPDETHHWKNAQYIHSHFALPPYTLDYLEAPQAPLYYILISPFASPVRPPPILQNPEAERIYGFHFDNMVRVRVDSFCFPNLFANCPGDAHRYWPIRRARLATIVFGLIAILFTAFAAQEATHSRAATVMAAALIGFLPQFDFRSASINNDTALVCFSAATIYVIVRMLMRGFELGPALCGSVALGLAFLSKISAAILVPVFALSIVLTAPNWRTRLKRLTYLLAICGLITLPWLLWNKVTYGDILASNKIAHMVPMMVTRRQITDPYFRTTFPEYLFVSYFGYFGWLTIRMAALIYKGYAALFIISMAGLCFVNAKRKGMLRVSLVMFATAALSLGFLLYASLTYPQPQGRLVYQSLTAMIVLIAAGLNAMPRFSRYVAVIVTVGLFSVDMYALSKVYRTYSGPTPRQESIDVEVAGIKEQTVPERVLEGHSYTQSLRSQHNDLTGIAFEVMPETSVAARTATHGLLVLSISTTPGGSPLAQVRTPASAITAQRPLELRFPPLTDSANKQYFASISAESMAPTDNYAIRVSTKDLYSSGSLTVDGRATGTDAVFRAFYSHPCWTCPLSAAELTGPLQ